MSIQKRTRSELNVFFQNGKTPPQGNFWDLIFSFWHKDDLIPANSIEGIQTYSLDATTSGAVSQIIPAGTLVEVITVVVDTPSDILISFNSAGGSEISSDLNQTAGTILTLEVTQYFNVETTVYLTGSAKFKIFTRS